MSAWDWVVETYARPGVETALLDLQDRCGQSIPLLLAAAWAAVDGRPFAAEPLEAAVETARAYDRAVIAPLRAIRRTLKGPVPDLEDAARQAMREQVKALELDAERRLFGALETIAREAGGGEATPVSTALISAAHAWGRVLPRAELASLAARLSP
jgi:uncharacterized protein (TIGR02444 family)